MKTRPNVRIITPLALSIGLVALFHGCETAPGAGDDNGAAYDMTGAGVPLAPDRPQVEFYGEDAIVHNGGPGDTTATYQDGEFNEYAPTYSNRVQTLVTGYCLRTAWILPKVNFVTDSRIKTFRSYQVSAHVEKPIPPYVLPPEPIPAPPKIVLRKEGDDVVCIGDNICYKIWFKNIGGSDAYNVVVEDVIPIAAELLMESAFVHPFFAEVEFIQDSNAEIRKIRFNIPGPVPPGHEGYVEFCIRLKERMPHFIAVKTGDPRHYVNEIANYQFHFTNDGTKAGYNLTIVDQMPNASEFIGASPPGYSFDPQTGRVTWPLAKLEQGETTPDYTLQLRGLEPGTRANNVHLESGRGIEAKAQAITEWIPGIPNLECRLRGPNQVKPGEPFTIGVEITNTGNGPAHGVHYLVPLPPSVSVVGGGSGGQLDFPIDVIQPGQTISHQFELVSQGSGSMNLVGRLTSSEGPGGDCRIDVLVAEVVLRIEKSGTRQMYVRQVGDYRIVVGNAGNAPATALVIEDILPPGLRFTSAENNGQFNQAENKIIWNVGDLAPGATVEVTYRASGIRPGDWVNQAIAIAREQTVRTEWTTRVISVPGMHIDVIDSVDPVEVGLETTFIMEVGNQSDDTRTTQIQVALELPPGMEFVSQVAPLGLGFRQDGQLITWDTIPEMGPKQEIEFRVTVRVTAAGDHITTGKLRYAEFGKEVITQEPTIGY